MMTHPRTAPSAPLRRVIATTELYTAGLSQRAVARALRISPRTVRRDLARFELFV